jgi:hypothetical protein
VGRRMPYVRLWILFVVVACTALASLLTAGANRSGAAATCQASAIHYRRVSGTPRGVAGVPWIASTNSAFRGYLFYFGATRWARTQPMDVRIFTTKAHMRVHPKVLWVALARSGSSLAITGTQLDGPGSFAAHYPAAIGGGQFPSYVSVPASGCWRVTVRSGSLRGSVTFIATDTE